MKNKPEMDWEGEGVQIFKPEDLVANELAKKFEMLMPGAPKERLKDMVDMVRYAKTPNFAWVPESVRGPVLHEARMAAQRFDELAAAKVEAEMKHEERAKAIPKLKKEDEAERQEVIAKFNDEFALERLAQKFELPPEDQGKVSQRQIPTMIVKREDLKK
ncbi:hypothetical protein K8R04_00210 [Candidatus Uhrbacteria bacterium]|nr:hypothetical protein [Candidatus Uhrbacteria bacterium]